MLITLIGSGALANLFGARLAPFAEVCLLGTWREGLEAVERDGIRLETGDDERVVRVRRATREPAEVGPADFGLVLVKSWQTERAAAQVAQVLGPGGVAITLQNGLGNLEHLQAALGSERALLGVTTLGATLLGPGHVRAGGEGPIYLPEDARLESLVELLRSAAFDVRRSPISALQSLQWGKLAVNCGINALTALLRVPNGELLKRSDARRLMERAAGEAVEVAAALGIQLPYADAAQEAAEVARATATNHSSMLQDVLRGALTEVDSINGAVVREGRRVGVATPVNEVLWRMVRATLPAKG